MYIYNHFSKKKKKKGKHFVLQIQKTANDPSTVSVISKHFFSWNPYQVMSYGGSNLGFKKDYAWNFSNKFHSNWPTRKIIEMFMYIEKAD
jgi:hypothetical protein